MTNNIKTGRISSIDMLRGIAIVGMVLCANIGFNSGLPAWMFHAQTPPPTYTFNPDVPGITWVDLVFPFFLFSMGAAFPFAMRKRLEGGKSGWAVAGGLVKRWLILTVFALILGNAPAVGGSGMPGWQINMFKIAVWAGMFLSLVRIQRPDASGWKKYLGLAVNLSGVAMLAALASVMVNWFEVPLDKGRCNIIIMILAVVSIWGGLIWMLTRNSLRLRWLAVLMIATFKALDSYMPEVLDFVPACAAIRWFFAWPWLQYLLIVVAGSIVGDMILSHAKSGEKLAMDSKCIWAGFIAPAAVIVQLWGLFSRHVLADFIISAALGAGFIALTWGRKDVYTKTAWVGFALMLTGIIFDPIDGGITKDHCNLSYLFTTSGMAALVTAFLLMLEARFSVKGRFISGVGQNPMLAYTVTSFLINPLLSLLGLLPLLYGLADGSQFWGIIQGIAITLLMMGTTFLFTKLKLFWRS